MDFDFERERDLDFDLLSRLRLLDLVLERSDPERLRDLDRLLDLDLLRDRPLSSLILSFLPSSSKSF